MQIENMLINARLRVIPKKLLSVYKQNLTAQ